MYQLGVALLFLVKKSTSKNKLSTDTYVTILFFSLLLVLSVVSINTNLQVSPLLCLLLSISQITIRVHVNYILRVLQDTPSNFLK